MIKKIRKIKKVNSQKGFTLLEILVVLTIMGFLIAMVAPRLAGIGDSAVDTICDTNQNRMMTYLSTYYQDTNGSLPDNLTNLVSEDGTGSVYAIPSVSDDDPDNGAEALSKEFNDRNHFVIHYLNAAEVAELADLGIENVFNLNEYAAAPTTLMASMDPKELAIGVGVAMTGIGADDIAITNVFALNHPGEKEWGEPKWFARIVFGLGPECGLITSGIIINAAHCPGGLQNADNATYNDYNVVVPRLAATADRLFAGTALGLIADADKAITAIAYDAPDLVIGSGEYIISTNLDGYRKRIFNLTAQEGWEYETQCPEGHMYPEVNDFWAIDTSGDGTIQDT